MSKKKSMFERFEVCGSQVILYFSEGGDGFSIAFDNENSLEAIAGWFGDMAKNHRGETDKERLLEYFHLGCSFQYLGKTLVVTRHSDDGIVCEYAGENGKISRRRYTLEEMGALERYFRNDD